MLHSRGPYILSRLFPSLLGPVFGTACLFMWDETQINKSGKFVVIVGNVTML